MVAVVTILATLCMLLLTYTLADECGRAGRWAAARCAGRGAGARSDRIGV